MTIEEAIERYSHNAEYEHANGNLQGCLEFRQLVDWLKDYKRLKEQEPKFMIKADGTIEPIIKIGHWIMHDNHRECSKCKVWLPKDMPRNSYCPNCGSKNEVSE